MTFVDLFSGIGGMALGLERAGMECRGLAEADDFCRRVLKKHWPATPIWEDIRRLSGHELERVDLISGGDPCQSASNARQHGAPQPALGDHFIRIVAINRPPLVLRENPTGTRSDAPWPWQRFRSALECLGYSVLPFRLRACCVGADHQRDRLWLLAELPHAHLKRLEGTQLQEVADTQGQGPDPHAARSAWGKPSPRLCARTDGLPNRVARLRALGNAVVPQVAETIGRMILEARREHLSGRR